MIAAEHRVGKVRSGFVAVAAIVLLAVGLATLAVVGKPTVIRRPAETGRPMLIIPDFVSRTGEADHSALAGELTVAVRDRLSTPESIFEVSPRRLRPVFSAEERETGLIRIAAELGADYVLVGSVESGPASSLGPGSVWSAPAGGAVRGDAAGLRLDILLVRDAEPPEVFAERFLLGDGGPDAEARQRMVRITADRIALSLRQP